MTFRRIATLVAAVVPAACTCTSDGLELERAYGNEHVVADVDAANMTVSLADGRQFLGPYTVDAGRVLATLTAVSGDELHCRLRLARHASDLVDGASGRCELRDGIAFDVEVASRVKEGFAERR